VLLGIVVVLALLVGLIFFVFGQVVPPDMIGIRRNFISFPPFLKPGFQEKGLYPGLHWKIPEVSTIQLIPRDFQFIHLNQRKISGDYTQKQLEVPTTDGSKVQADITLILRFFEEPNKSDEPQKIDLIAGEEGERRVPFATRSITSHGGPNDLANTYSLDRQTQLRIFTVTAEEKLKETLSNLSTQDYYDPVLREIAALNASRQVNEIVNPDGIELWATLIRRYIYSEKRIDDQIFNKNLQEATERLNAAERSLQQAKAETEETAARWDAEIKDLRVQGEQQRAVIMSEADRFEVEKISEGDRLIQEAIAKVDKAKNKILTEVDGAEVYVAREMTPLLETLEGGVVTDIDPYDIDAWVKKLVNVSKRRQAIE
jgi:regulator of protease activity HflC (stomatin/prohibitin superfamily)